METRTEDVIRLMDISRSIMEVQGYVGEADYSDFSQREDMRKEITAQLAQIGGAAALLTDEFKEEHGDVDWEMLKGLQFSNFDDELEMDAHSIFYLVREDLPEINDKVQDLVTNLSDNTALDEVTLNEEDKADVQEIYRNKNRTVDHRNEDIRFEDDTPPLRGEDETDSPEQNFIESREERREGPFNP